MSGIDKTFDYLVPARLVDSVRPGVRVRVNLNGRRVSGWVVALAETSAVDPARLIEVVSVSGPSIEPEIIPLSRWVASHWFGSWRSVLASASAPRVRGRMVSPRRGHRIQKADDEVSKRAAELLDVGGGLLVVPPLASALSAVSEAASRGPVLVVCPTMRMVRMGAAALRRRGFITAELPDEWESARAGVDIVLAARSGVLGPCRDLTSIVVVDEHEEVLQEERSPTWQASSVAIERARMAGVPILLTSPVPSPMATAVCKGRTAHVKVPIGWPKFHVDDLSEVPVAGSLLGRSLLDVARRPSLTVACVLNTTGVARLVACSACTRVQSCGECDSPLGVDSEGLLTCHRCGRPAGSVCVFCGRAAFKLLSGGVGLLARQLRKATGREVAEVTAASDVSVEIDGLTVGTEALLNRLPTADVVVFCDIDRDLMAPRVSAPRETLAMVARAARLVGVRGTVILQTRTPLHPVIAALSASEPGEGLQEWSAKDIANRRDLGLPPFFRVVRIHGVSGDEVSGVCGEGVETAIEGDSILLRSVEPSLLASCIDRIRQVSVSQVRVHADPARY